MISLLHVYAQQIIFSDREEAKRKLTFSEEKQSKDEQSNLSFPLYGCQQLINNNFQPIIPPQQPWPSVANGGTNTNLLTNFNETEDASCVDETKSFEKSPHIESEEGATSVNIDVEDLESENDVNHVEQREKEKEDGNEDEDLSPLAQFCASLFRPSSSNSSFDCQSFE